MSNNSIFKQVKSQIVSDGTVLDYLVGYAKLISMNEEQLCILFESEEEKRDLADIRRIMERHDIDVKLLKVAGSFLRSNKATPEEEKIIKEIQNIENDSTVKASDILTILFEAAPPVLEMVKKGHTLDDVIAYYDKNKGKSSTKHNIAGTKNEQRIDAERNKDSFKILVKKSVQLYDSLKNRVVGQDEAIRLFVEGYFQSEVFFDVEREKKGPSAVFLFAGPPGVGKTYLSSAAAEILGLPFLRIDMSEYTNETTVHRLSGTPKTYHAPKEGELTGFVKKNPRSIILLDEVEKACEEVVMQFLQVLDGGVLTDSFLSETVSFRNTILIFTTNVGKKLYEDRDRMNLSSVSRAVVMKEIENEKDNLGNSVFPSAICSRFASGNVIMFNHLGIHDLIKIIDEKFSESAAMISENYGYRVSIDDKLSPMLVYSQSTSMDARNMSSQASLLIKNQLYEFGRHIPEEVDYLTKLEQIDFKLKYETGSDTADLFENSDVSDVLYVGEADDIKNLQVSDKCNIRACESEEALDIIAKEDISFVLVNIEYENGVDTEGYLSLDDIKSKGVVAFDTITDKLPQVPIYIIHKSHIKKQDRTNFLERGARGFIEWKDDKEIEQTVIKIADVVYMQKRVDELSDRGRVLKYNTAQRIVNDGKNAEIVFYDFKTVVAADADENKMLLSDEERPKEKFSDVIGAGDAKSELEYFTKYLKNPKEYMANSIKPPKGILLYGPPGTGKTMLARAMAGESDVPFFSATATGFMNKYVGESEANIRRLFATAKKFAPSIIFIDEIDAIGKERTGSDTTQHTETMLNALLTEMDGFEVNKAKPVFVVAATNYDLDGTKSGKVSGLDDALLRRFDNRIYVDLPKESERKEYIDLQLAKINDKNITEDVVKNISERTTGQSLAMLKNLIDFVLRKSAKENREFNNELMTEAFEEFMYGEKKEWDEEYYKSVAIHESGHAYICYLSGEKPSFVTIVSRGDFGGYMQHANSEKTPSYTKEQLLWKIRISLAGRVAELEFFGDRGINTGISSDIRHATGIAMDIINKYAMVDDRLVSLPIETVLNSEAGNSLIEQAEVILEEEMKITKELVHKGREKIEALAKFLQENNQANEGQITKIFENK